MPVYRYVDKDPRVDPAAFVAPDAAVVGDVTIGPRAQIPRLVFITVLPTR